MKVTLFDAKGYDRETFEKENKGRYELSYFDVGLAAKTASLASGSDVVVPFVNDDISKETLKVLKKEGVKLVALRCAGFNNVDIESANSLGIPVVRVPAYSPHAVAEAAFALLLALDRKLVHSYVRTREFNFSLSGLVGFDLYGNTVGVIGTGKIGRCFIEIAKGFGMKVLCYDPYPSEIEGAEFVELDTLFAQSDIISLHCPLTRETKHIIDRDSIEIMKKGVYIINTSRGALIRSDDLLEGLKSKKIGGAGLDVYEEESGIFFEDNSEYGVDDDILARLISMPNVLVTGHQAYLTSEALMNIASVTFDNIDAFFSGKELLNQVK